jgi:hypothetical protein
MALLLRRMEKNGLNVCVLEKYGSMGSFLLVNKELVAALAENICVSVEMKSKS